MKHQDIFVVFYREKNSWHISQEFNTPKKALAFMDGKRKKGQNAYAAHLGTIIENLPDLVFFEVERQLQQS